MLGPVLLLLLLLLLLQYKSCSSEPSLFIPVRQESEGPLL
jgi:hypothetical protein